MKINRIVEGVECEIDVPFDINKKVSEMHNDLVDTIDSSIDSLVPDDLREKLDEGQYSNAKKKSINYALDALKESEMEYTACIDDALCLLYDEIENIRDTYDVESEFYRVRTTTAKRLMLENYMSLNQIWYDRRSDPFELTVEEGIMDALSRGVSPSNVSSDVYEQLYQVINESDIFDAMIDDYMIVNSI